MALRAFAAVWTLTVAYASCVVAEDATSQWLDSYSAGMQQAKQSGPGCLNRGGIDNPHQNQRQAQQKNHHEHESQRRQFATEKRA